MFKKQNKYTNRLQTHYEAHFKTKGTRKKWNVDPNNKLRKEFHVLEISPNKVHNMWAYCTLGMSLDREDNNLIEAVIYSPREDEALVELLSLVSSFHNNSAALNLHHTFEIGHSWLDDSLCNYGFVSLPYLDGEGLEIFKFEDKVFHCYWIIPITKSERELKIKHGCEALENLFEEKGINYVNPNRLSLV